jgi:hypothetical protein
MFMRPDYTRYGLNTLSEEKKTRRRSGCIVSILGALIGLSVVAIHASGTSGIHGTFFHVWLLIAIGSASLFSLILAVIGLIDIASTPHGQVD